MLAEAFQEVCIGDEDSGGGHDLEQALNWSRSPPPNGRTCSARKMLNDAAGPDARTLLVISPLRRTQLVFQISFTKRKLPHH